MIVTCERGCGASFDDAFRTTICPHDTFAANSWRPDHPVNAFAHHPESPLSGPHAPCPACPAEVRGLYAVAWNLLNHRGDEPDVWDRKIVQRLDELQVAVDRMTPLIDGHFGDAKEVRA